MPTILIEEGKVPSLARAFDSYQMYNCLDAAITAQLPEPMKAEARNTHLSTYEREMRLQSLCLHMSATGLPISHIDMLDLVKKLEADEAKCNRLLKRWCEAVYYPLLTLNPNSPQQVAGFFYDYLQIPPVWKWDHKNKQRKRDTSRGALEKLRETRPIAAPFVNAILAAREARKLAGVFKKGLEPGHPPRLRAGFSPSGTETGRLASQTNVYGRGTNVQNWNEVVRQVVAAEEDRALVYVDLKTAESIATGYISRCRPYIEACLTGDVHTAACRLNWPEVEWTGDLRRDRALAEETYYRVFSRRDIMKKGGHATNYYGKPPTISKVALMGLVPVELVIDFQNRYFREFPEIRDWHVSTIAEIQQSGILVNPLGRERRFWGRPNDEETYRKAIAFLPQSTVADVMDEGLMQVQHWIIADRLDIQLLAQVHDAGLFELAIADLGWAVPELLRRIVFPVDFGDLGIMTIPAEATFGKNWRKAKYDKGTGNWKNPQGLRDWSPDAPLHFS